MERTSTFGTPILSSGDAKFPWWGVAALVIVFLAVVAALIASIVLCWHYHSEHEAGDARAGNMEQCIESIHPFPSVALTQHQDTQRGQPFIRRSSARSLDGSRSRDDGASHVCTAPMFSRADYLSTLEAAFFKAAQ